MKKILCTVIALTLVFVLTACAHPAECNYDEFMKNIKEEETVTVYLHGDDGAEYSVDVCDEFLELLKGEFTEGGSASDKIVTVGISDSYEMSLFDNGSAVIFYGVAGIFESDRQYYEYKLDKGTEAIVKYVMENGSKVTDLNESEAK